MAKKKEGRLTSQEAQPVPPALPGDCLSLGTAGQIVQAAIPGGPQPIDKTLKGVGLITENQREVFRKHVFGGVTCPRSLYQS